MNPRRLEDIPLRGDLPTLPAVALEVLRVCQDPEATLADLTEVLSRDPALSAKVLQMSNSPMFGRGGGPVTSLQRATTLLGFRAVKAIALSFSLASELPMAGESAGLDLASYWHRSVVNAVVARSVAQVLGSRLAEEAFLAGLLADIGKLVLATRAPDDYAPLVAETGGWPDAGSERTALGYDSVDVAVLLLESWGVPGIFAEAVRHGARFTEAPDASPKAAELAQLLRLALRTSRVLFDDDKGLAMAALTEEASRFPELDGPAVEGLVERVQAGVAATAAALDVALPAGVSYQSILDAARYEMMLLSLDATAVLERERARAEQLEGLALRDPLTGLPNRAALDEFLASQVAARDRWGGDRALGVVMIDIDRFKQINDTYGHPAGDEVLRALGELLSRQTRTDELVARYGGEEFVLVAPSTIPEELRALSERLRQVLSRARIPVGDDSIQITASFGAACSRRITGPDDARLLLAKADRQLYNAKAQGRNRVEVDLSDDLPGRSAGAECGA